jgi:hypothetical protein
LEGAVLAFRVGHHDPASAVRQVAVRFDAGAEGDRAFDLLGAGAARWCEVEVEAVLGLLGVSGPHEEEAGRAGREFDQDLVAGFNGRFRPVG